jgi:hypothetical protein
LIIIAEGKLKILSCLFIFNTHDYLSKENIRRFTIDLSALMAKVHDEAVELRIRLQFNEAQGMIKNNLKSSIE